MAKRKALPTVTVATAPIVTTCAGCGACCTGQAGLPVHLVGDFAGAFLVVPLPEALAQELRDTVARWNAAEAWPADGSACIWYDPLTRRCRHYEFRPNVCRTLAVDSDGCHRWRKALGIEARTVWVRKGGRLVRETR